MTTMHFNLFGKFKICYGERELAGFGPRKVQELICYLLVHRHQKHSREVLANNWWLDYPSNRSKRNLRQLLYQFHTALQLEKAISNPMLLVVEPEWVYVNPKTDFWLDIDQFEKAYLATKAISAQSLTSNQVRLLQNAVELYTGELLEGWYHDWCIFERERQQKLYLSMLDKLLSYCEATKAYENGLTYGSLILQCDRAREHTHRCLMRMSYLVGDRTTAMRQYDTCVAALAEELNVRPSQSTIELYEQISNDCVPESPSSVTEHLPGIRSNYVDKLAKLQEALNGLQKQINDCLEIFEETLSR